jgi:hypothetical protein
VETNPNEHEKPDEAERLRQGQKERFHERQS